MVRHIFRSWLQNAARQKVRKKVMEAAAAEMERGAAGGQGAMLACDVAVLFALGIEAGGLRDRLADEFSIRGHGFVARFGRLGQRRLLVVQSGAGAEAAQRAGRAVIAAHRPPWLVVAGFAGGLQPQLRRFDLVMANSVVDTSGNRLAIDVKVDPGSPAQQSGLHVGRLLSVDRIVRKPQEKADLGRRFQALAADMESYAVAKVCAEQQVRCLVVRVITDPVDEALPKDVERMLDQPTRAARLGAAVGALWKRPGSVKDMWRLKENALTASERLARFLVGAIAQLTPPAD